MICKYYGDKIISKFNKEKYNKEYLLKYIDCHDIITFDIFDTLLMRKTIHNYDVFELVENRAKKYKLNLISFAKTRKIAEYNLVKKGEYNFDDIYNEIVRMTGINVVDKELLMSIEKI